MKVLLGKMGFGDYNAGSGGLGSVWRPGGLWVLVAAFHDDTSAVSSDASLF